MCFGVLLALFSSLILFFFHHIYHALNEKLSFFPSVPKSALCSPTNQPTVNHKLSFRPLPAHSLPTCIRCHTPTHQPTNPSTRLGICCTESRATTATTTTTTASSPPTIPIPKNLLVYRVEASRGTCVDVPILSTYLPSLPADRVHPPGSLPSTPAHLVQRVSERAPPSLPDASDGASPHARRYARYTTLRHATHASIPPDRHTSVLLLVHHRSTVRTTEAANVSSQ